VTLDGADAATVRHAVAHEETRLLDVAADADALVADSNTPVTGDVLRALDLDVVGRAGVGVDNVALEAAERAGTTVVNVPDYARDEVATHALSLLLAGARGVPTYDAATRGDDWDWTVGRPVHRVPGQTLCLFGFGSIARRLTELAAGYDFEVLAHDPYVDADEMAEWGVERVGFDDLLARADLLSLHAPATPETRGRFDAAAFEAMADGTVFVNTARGALVEVDALVDALADGTVLRAGVDVLPEEPPPDDALTGRDDVFVTPHVGWYSEDAKAELRRRVAADVGRVLAGEVPESPVEPGDGW